MSNISHLRHDIVVDSFNEKNNDRNRLSIFQVPSVLLHAVSAAEGGYLHFILLTAPVKNRPKKADMYQVQTIHSSPFSSKPRFN